LTTRDEIVRGETSLIQTIGRAARKIRGKVIMYAEGSLASATS